MNASTNARRVRWFLGLLFGLLLLASRAARAEDNSDNSIKVDRLTFEVTLADNQRHTIVGYLYYQGSYVNRPLQVVVHGGSYNHGYWDVPDIGGHGYSYARYMAARKYAVLAIDQLGTGESSHPDGDLVTLEALSSSVCQLVGQLREGSGPLPHPFRQIALVGHSFGASTSIHAQASCQPADALVTMQMGHVPHPLPIPPELVTYFAAFEYFSPPAELRAALYYHAPAADPRVIAYDQERFGTELISRGELFTLFLTFFDPAATRVGEVPGPVLVQLAEYDALFPTAYASQEAAYWTSASSVTVQELPGVGHDVNLHLDNHRSWEQVDAWLRATLGIRGAR